MYFPKCKFLSDHFLIAHAESRMLATEFNAVFGEKEKRMILRFPAPFDLVDIVRRTVGVVVTSFCPVHFDSEWRKGAPCEVSRMPMARRVIRSISSMEASGQEYCSLSNRV